MESKKDKRSGEDTASVGAKTTARNGGTAEGGMAVSVSGWKEKLSTKWKTFPVEDAFEKLRVHMSAGCYAELVSHAKEDMGREVCGVLVGEFCEDTHGVYVSVEAVIRGASTRNGSSHVTYTQETWNKIHQEMEKRYKAYSIVGWYHSHPGFGVDFSDMDVFIQQNFFSGNGQIALVTDPLGGEEAICFNGDGGIEYLGAFWVAGRARQCRVPTRKKSDGGEASSTVGDDSLQSLEARVSQALHAVESLKANFQFFLMFVGMLLAAALICYVSTSIYDRYTGMVSQEGIKPLNPGPVAVKIGGEWVWLNTTLVTQKVPPELAERLSEAEQKSVQAGKDASAANSASSKTPTTAAAAATKTPTTAAAGGKK